MEEQKKLTIQQVTSNLDNPQMEIRRPTGFEKEAPQSLEYYVNGLPVTREDYLAVLQANRLVANEVMTDNVDGLGDRSGTGITDSLALLAYHLDASNKDSFANQLLAALHDR